MKNSIKVFAFFLLLSTLSWTNIQHAHAQQGSVSLQVFYDELSPYGTWVDNANYGYVWMPNVARGFIPYGTNGHWVFTDEGWTWYSNYAWGWAPFHYGRWFTDSNYGPMWIPDTEWGPGWVSWRQSNNYYGWAPLGPRAGTGRNYQVPYNQWRFVLGVHLGRNDLNNYYANASNNRVYIRNSSLINNYRYNKTYNIGYNGGPHQVDIERRTGKKITPMDMRNGNRPGQNLNDHHFQTYRPQIHQSNGPKGKPAPTNVMPRGGARNPNNRMPQTPQPRTNPNPRQPPIERREQPRTNPNPRNPTIERREQPRTNPSPRKPPVGRLQPKPQTNGGGRQQPRPSGQPERH